MSYSYDSSSLGWPYGSTSEPSPTSSHSSYEYPYSPASANPGYSGNEYFPEPIYAESSYDDMNNYALGDSSVNSYEPPKPHKKRSSRQSQSGGSISGGSNHDKEYCCLAEGCEYTSNRPYDLNRHMAARHKSAKEMAESGKMFDCPHPKCGSKGEHGFKRKDHLRDHTRRTHCRELGGGNRLGKKHVPKKHDNHRSMGQSAFEAEENWA